MGQDGRGLTVTGRPVRHTPDHDQLPGVTPAALGTVRVTGSRSGVHPGSLVADPDGATIWKPWAPSVPGERVTVHTAVTIAGAKGHSFNFTVARIATHAVRLGLHLLASLWIIGEGGRRRQERWA